MSRKQTDEAPALSLQSVNDTLAQLQCARATLYQILAAGEIDSFMQGRSRRIVKQSVQKYIQRRIELERQRRQSA